MQTKPKISLAPAGALDKAIEQAGGITALAAKIGVSKQAIAGWGYQGRIPAERVPAVAEATGMSKEELRPDLFDEVMQPGAHYLPRGKLPREMIDELSRAEAACDASHDAECFRLKRAAAEIVPLLWELLG